MNRRSRRGEDSATTRSQAESVVEGAIAGRVVPDHELTVVGVGNVNRAFDIDDFSNGPSVVFRESLPYDAFLRGWTASESDGISDQDVGAALEFADPPTKTLYPVTPFAEAVAADVWPVVSNLFSSGTGYRHTTTLAEFVRYQAQLIDAYIHLLDIVWINKMTYHFDWSSVFPFTNTVPNYFYDLAIALNATDVGLADTWLPLIKRLDTKICMPAMIAEVKRMKTPMFSLDLNGRIYVITRHNLFENLPNKGSDYYNIVKDALDYMDGALAAAGAVFQSFLPFPMEAADPWTLADRPQVDVDRSSGFYNAPVVYYDTFGDTGDPTANNAMIIETQDGATEKQTILYSRHPQPTWSELKMLSIYELQKSVTDDTFRLVTVHSTYQAYIPDDEQDVLVYNGVPYDISSNEYRYEDFINSRFRSGTLTYGSMQPGLCGAWLPLEPILRLVRLEANYIFMTRVLKTVTVNAAGASLRELRYYISEEVQNAMKTGIA